MVQLKNLKKTSAYKDQFKKFINKFEVKLYIMLKIGLSIFGYLYIYIVLNISLKNNKALSNESSK